MSPRASRLAVLSAALMCGLAPAPAQTIADYSRAQRLLLESTMSQAAARSAGLGAAAPSGAASAPASTASMPRPMPPVPSMPAPAPAPGVQVSGVFASTAATVAEVVVNATPYLLRAGQGVPGTAWHVETVAADRVVLRRPAAIATLGGRDTVRVFDLPALRRD